MKVKPLLPQQYATAEGQHPSPELVEVIQRLVARVDELSAVIEAIRAVPEPTGGGTVDAEARAAINAIRGI